jgi:hypothetical protein
MQEQFGRDIHTGMRMSREDPSSMRFAQRSVVSAHIVSKRRVEIAVYLRSKHRPSNARRTH